MGIILDIIILVLFGLSVFLGYKKGLIGVVFNLCALLVSIIITVVLYNPVTSLVINSTQLDDNIKNAIIENGVINEDSDKEEKEENSINEYIQEYITNNIKDAANNTIENNAGIIAERITAIIVAIGLFIVVRLGLILLKFIAEGIASLPIIKQFNELGGIVYGVLRGTIVIYVLLALCFFVLSISEFEFLANMINTSIIGKFLYTNNIILNIIF